MAWSISVLFKRERRTPIRHRDSGGGGPPYAAGWWRGRRPQRNESVLNLLGHTSPFFNNKKAASHAPPPPRFARFASSSGPPPPLSRGRKVFAVSRRLRARVLPRHSQEKSCSPDGAERNPGTKIRLKCRSRISLRSIRATEKLRRRSADRRRGYCPSHANECCHSPALRARRALKRSALVCRRSAAALAAANERHRSTPARASWDPASSGFTRIWPVHSVQRVASQYRS